MRIQDAIDLLNSKFQYTSDGGIDQWSVLNTDQPVVQGDCEDYALTLVWLAGDRSVLRMLWNLLTIQHVIWYVKSPRNVGHAVLYVPAQGLYIDNIQRRLVSRDDLAGAGYRMIFPYVSLLVLPKLVLGWVLGRFVS